MSKRRARKPARQFGKIAVKIRGDNHDKTGRGLSYGRVNRRLDILATTAPLARNATVCAGPSCTRSNIGCSLFFASSYGD